MPRNIKQIAETESNWNYYLIATTLEVYASQVLTDLYGDIPYTEANISSILNPVFDSQETIYDLMAADLKTALAKDFSESSVDNAPGATDFVFAGDMEKWKAFANTLLLKVYLRQTEVRPSVAQAGVEELLNAGTAFLGTHAAITQYTDEDSRSNPLYETDRRQLNVGTNLRASTTLGSFLDANADPRLAFVYDGSTFQNQGDFDSGSSTASVVLLSATSPYYFISLAESKFLQAEAEARYGNASNAETFYGEGVSAAFAQFDTADATVDGSALLAGNYAYPAGTLAENIEAIITQKWISLFPGNGFEAFIEHNRTGYPEVSTVDQTAATYVPGQFAYAVEGITSGVFPKRIPLPQDETQRNSNAPKTVKAITEAVWYDIN
jgi:hypothetical protein